MGFVLMRFLNGGGVTTNNKQGPGFQTNTPILQRKKGLETELMIDHAYVRKPPYKTPKSRVQRVLGLVNCIWGDEVHPKDSMGVMWLFPHCLSCAHGYSSVSCRVLYNTLGHKKKLSSSIHQGTQQIKLNLKR